MDKLLTVVLVLCSLSTYAQSDTTLKKVNFQIEINNGYSTFNRTRLGATLTTIYSLSSKMSVGLGYRHSHIFERWGGLRFMPYDIDAITLKTNFNLTSSQTPVFSTFETGIQFQINSVNTNTKPLFMNIGLGKEFIAGNKNMYLSTTYGYDKSRFTYGHYGGSVDQSVWYRNHSFNINLGFEF